MSPAIDSVDFHTHRYATYQANTPDKFYLIKVFNIIQNLRQTGTLPTHTTSLDIGCADGSFSSRLKETFGFDTHGIDLSPTVVRLAQQKGVHARVHNIQQRFPFKERTFDLVLACEVIEHVYDTDFLISEMKRILKNNGVLIITTPNLVSLLNRTLILFGCYPYGPEYRVGHPDNAGHIRTYTPATISHQLYEHSLITVLQTTPNIPFPMTLTFIPQFFKEIAMRLGDLFPTLGSNIIIVAKK